MFVGAFLTIVAAAAVLVAIFAALTWLVEPGSFGAPAELRVVQARPHSFWIEQRSRMGWKLAIPVYFRSEAEAIEAMALVAAPRIVATQCRP